MTVGECIQEYKSRYRSNLRRVWLCPDIVQTPKVGKNYVIDVHIDNKLPESLLNVQAVKHWMETSHMICIIYKASPEILELVSSRLTGPSNVADVLNQEEAE